MAGPANSNLAQSTTATNIHESSSAAPLGSSSNPEAAVQLQTAIKDFLGLNDPPFSDPPGTNDIEVEDTSVDPPTTTTVKIPSPAMVSKMNSKALKLTNAIIAYINARLSEVD